MQTKFNWSDMKVLLAFGRSGTLSDAALELLMDETTAARRLKRLETSLGFPLTSRDGNKLKLTSAGKVALDHAQTMEAAALQLERLHATTAKAVSGVVRITGLAYVLNHVIIPALPNFMASHPGICIHIQIENRNLDLATFETDVAVRMGAPTNTRVSADKLADLAFAAYRPRNRFQGVPLKRCLWIGPDSGVRMIPEAAWLEANIPAERIVMRSNANMCNAAAVKSGLVCAVLPSIIGDNDKDMVRMDEGVLLHREMWLLRRPDTEAGSAVGVTVDWLKAVFHAVAEQLAG